VEPREILGAVRRFWAVALIVLSACLAAAEAVVALSPKHYEATATVAVKPRSPSGVELVEFMIPALEARVESRSLHQALAAAVARGGGGDFGVNAVINPGSGVMRIVVRGTDQEAVAPIANNVALRLRQPSQDAGVLVVLPLDAAVRPAAPVAPAAVPLLLSGLVLGLIAAVFGALALQSVSRRNELGAQLRDRLGVPLLGTVPQWRRPRRFSAWSPARQLLYGTHREAVEACQEVRANLQIALLRKGVGAIAVTGVGARDVAAVITAMLGWSLAAVGRNVLLLDGDLRRPALTRALGGELTADGQLADGHALLRLADPPGLPLRLLAADSVRELGRAATQGPVPDPDRQHPAEALTRGLPQLLQTLHEPDRLTIVNTPPVDVVDSKLVASMTGSMVVVADIGSRATLPALQRLVAECRDAGADVLGIVLVAPARRWRVAGRRKPRR